MSSQRERERVVLTTSRRSCPDQVNCNLRRTESDMWYWRTLVAIRTRFKTWPSPRTLRLEKPARSLRRSSSDCGDLFLFARAQVQCWSNRLHTLAQFGEQGSDGRRGQRLIHLGQSPGPTYMLGVCVGVHTKRRGDGVSYQRRLAHSSASASTIVLAIGQGSGQPIPRGAV